MPTPTLCHPSLYLYSTQPCVYIQRSDGNLSTVAVSHKLLLNYNIMLLKSDVFLMQHNYPAETEFTALYVCDRGASGTVILTKLTDMMDEIFHTYIYVQK